MTVALVRFAEFAGLPALAGRDAGGRSACVSITDAGRNALRAFAYLDPTVAVGEYD